jgi:hypothetical protein
MQKGGVVMAIAADEIEIKLTYNIGLMAKSLKKAGFDLKEFDRIGQDVLEFIENKAEQATIKNPLQAQNVENLIIMLLMHGAIISQKQFLKQTSSSLGVSEQKIMDIMMKDMV